MKHYDTNSERVKEWKRKLKERIEKKRLEKLKKENQNDTNQRRQ